MVIRLIMFETTFTVGMSFSLVLAPSTILLTISLGNCMDGRSCVIHCEASFVVRTDLSISLTCSLATVTFRCKDRISFIMQKKSGSACMFETLNILLAYMCMILFRPNAIVCFRSAPHVPNCTELNIARDSV